MTTEPHIWRLKDAPPRLKELPEPLRSKAVEAANELIHEGVDRDEALDRAIDQAWNYRSDRMPHSHAPESE